MYAYCEATVPKVTVVTRKAIGGSLLRHGLQAHPCRRQPGLADRRDRHHVGPEAAIDIVYKQELIMADDPQEKRDELIAGVSQGRTPSPSSPRRSGYLDDIIEPKDTRIKLIDALRMLRPQARGPAGQEAWEHAAVRCST